MSYDPTSIIQPSHYKELYTNEELKRFQFNDSLYNFWGQESGYGTDQWTNSYFFKKFYTLRYICSYLKCADWRSAFDWATERQCDIHSIPRHLQGELFNPLMYRFNTTQSGVTL